MDFFTKTKEMRSWLRRLPSSGTYDRVTMHISTDHLSKRR